MKTSWKVLLGDLLLVGLVGFVLAGEKPVQNVPAKPAAPQKAETPAPTASVVAPSPDFPVIGYIERRDRTITIKSSPKGPVYSVKTSEGKVLFENLSAEQLRAQAPELHEFIKSAVAGNSVVVDTNGQRYPLSIPDARTRMKMDAKARPKMDASIGLAR